MGFVFVLLRRVEGECISKHAWSFDIGLLLTGVMGVVAAGSWGTNGPC
jgi:hypothetical protein